MVSTTVQRIIVQHIETPDLTSDSDCRSKGYPFYSFIPIESRSKRIKYTRTRYSLAEGGVVTLVGAGRPRLGPVRVIHNTSEAVSLRRKRASIKSISRALHFRDTSDSKFFASLVGDITRNAFRHRCVKKIRGCAIFLFRLKSTGFLRNVAQIGLCLFALKSFFLRREILDKELYAVRCGCISIGHNSYWLVENIRSK